MTTKINADANGLTETVDTSGILEIQTNGTAAVIIGVDQNANFTSTGAITVPAGTTAQRPTPVNGMMRYNSNVAVFEVYANNVWSAANVTPAPTNTVAPVISGSAVVGQNLTCTTGTWSGSPSAYFYQWRANSTAISNATANVFTLTSTQTGANITCNVIAQNIAGNSSPATSNSLGPVVLGTTVNYLIVAGGGGSGGAAPNYVASGGGGAGGLLTGTTILQPANTYSITIGAGGAGGAAGFTNGNNGGNSSFSAIANVAVGGALGQGYNQSGATGGSGGGGANNNQAGSAGTAGQGFAGGNGGVYSNSNATQGAGGGGGSSQAGFNFSGTGSGGSNNGGAGGNGTSSSISGVATYYAGGGGGGAATGTGGAGGLGGGGAGNSGWAAVGSGTPGSASTGGGGGGSSTQLSNSYAGASGGSGIVIISYAGAQQFGGGVISTDGSNTIHTFTTSGSLVPLTALSANYLVVAGGGGGGGSVGGGGGGGGLLSGSNVTIDSSSTYIITVGSGGAGGSSSNQGANGANSSFSALANTAIGGGGGGGNGFPSSGSNSYGLNGGSGGGVGWNNTGTNNGLGTAGQGNNGGITSTNNGDTNYSAGGGGGAGQVGFNGNGAGGAGGKGGNGAVSSISGVATYYAGGGGGVGTSSNGAGGLGGGGAGNGSGTATSGTSNTGGGGGGGGTSGSGGSGVVIISYPGSTPMMAGGNVTVVSNTVVHTFTSSGYLTPFVNMNNSLRFRASASAFLNRTPTLTGNQQKFTFSTWVKEGILSAYGHLFSLPNNNSSFRQTNTNTLQLYFNNGNDGALETNAVYRDPAAWYHIVLAIDTTQATASNRVILYVNGVQQTFTGSGYPAQNYNTAFNTVVLHRIGQYQSSEYFDGYMTEVRLIDGQQLTPYAFGNFNQYGVWAPVAYAGSYGTNGFYLNFGNTANTTALGFDSSPQGNNWTTNNFSLTAGATYDSMVDVPTLTSANVANYCVLNPLNYSTGTVSNGNLQWASSSGTGNGCFATIAFDIASSNQYYWEFTLSSGDVTFGIAPTTLAPSNTSRPGSYSYYTNGNKYSGTSASSYGASYTSGDVIGVTVGNGTITFYKNGTSQGSAFTGLTGIFTPAIWEVSGTFIANFGQRPFAYTAPAGYLPLNTYNM